MNDKEQFREWYKQKCENSNGVLNEYINDFLTVEAMADYYGIDAVRLRSVIESERQEYKRLHEWIQKAQKFIDTGSYY